MASSAAFRGAARTLERDPWSALRNNIRENRNSIEVFAKSRGLNWTGALQQTEQVASHVKDFDERYPEIVANHPHAYTVPHGSEPLEYATHNRTVRNLYNPKDWPKGKKKRPAAWNVNRKYPSDPTLHQNEICEIRSCDKSPCECDPLTSDRVVRPLVELVQFGGKGVGVRALHPVRKEQLLDEYVGRLLYPKSLVNTAYALQFAGGPNKGWIAQIQADESGNWTRYMSHSCEYASIFIPTVIGKRQTMMIESIKDVAMFEELTVDYGHGYWAIRAFGCLCGSTECRYATQKQMDFWKEDGKRLGLNGRKL